MRKIIIVANAFSRIAIKEFAKYFLVSLIALIIDFAIFIGLAKVTHYAIAATISLTVGTFVHYALSIRYVFHRRKLLAYKRTETMLFILAGVLGLGVNVAAIAAFVEWLALSLPISKILAAGVSFIFGYVSRKLALF